MDLSWVKHQSFPISSALKHKLEAGITLGFKNNLLMKDRTNLRLIANGEREPACGYQRVPYITVALRVAG